MATLLLADDSSSLARTIELAFSQDDLRVASVLSGQGAVAYLETDRPDIVLADIGMARVSGYDLAAYIKKSPALAGIPVLLLASPFDRIDEQKARATGCDGVVVKPFVPSLLVEIVRRLLAGDHVDPSLLWPADMPRVGSWETDRAPAATAVDAPVEAPGQAQGRLLGWEASRAGLPQRSNEPFDAGLDQLDAAFGNVNASASLLTAEAAAEFASDLNVLRSNVSGRARRSTSIERAAAPKAPVLPSSPEDGLDAFAAPHESWLPTQPAAAPVKVRMKVRSMEFEAEGPAKAVQAQLKEFMRLAGTSSESAPRRRKSARSALLMVPLRHTAGHNEKR